MGSSRDQRRGSQDGRSKRKKLKRRQERNKRKRQKKEKMIDVKKVAEKWKIWDK